MANFATEIPHKPSCTKTSGIRYYMHAALQLPMQQCRLCKRFARDVEDHADERAEQEVVRAANRQPDDPQPVRPAGPPSSSLPPTRPDLEATALPMLNEATVDGFEWARNNGVAYYRPDRHGNLKKVE